MLFKNLTDKCRLPLDFVDLVGQSEKIKMYSVTFASWNCVCNLLTLTDQNPAPSDLSRAASRRSPPPTFACRRDLQS